MREKKLLLCSNFLWMFAVVLLQSCGGGGGSSKPVSTSTNSIAFSTSSPTSSAPSPISSSSSSVQSSAKLTITGLVVADALANADIEFSVGTQHFTAKANDQKQYSIELNVLPENLATPLTAQVTGVNSNKWVKFAALFPSINKLKTFAGDDGVLNVSEYFGVNISALTTAEFVLVNESKRKINNDDERKWALVEVSYERRAEMATILNTLLTDVRLNLPKNTSTTLDFLLNENTSTAYINILKLSTPSQFDDSRESIEQDANQTKSPYRVIEGKYLVHSKNVIYLIELNNDGTGRFQSGSTPSTQLQTFGSTNSVSYVDAPITWIKKDKSIKIGFSNPVNYGKISGYLDPNQTNVYVPCEYSESPPCNLTLSSILLTIISDNEVSTSVKMTIEAALKDSYGYAVYDYANQIQYATMWNAAEFLKPTSKDVEGYEWYLDNFKYIFNSNGTASQTDLLTKQERSVDWRIENGHLSLDNSAIDIWLNYPTESGFVVTKLAQNTNQYSALLKRPMVKRQTVKMTNQDWVGRWTAFPKGVESSFYDVYSSGKWRDSFEPDSRGSWSVLDDTKQTALSDGTWRMQRDLLAVYDGRYYIQLCQGNESENFTPMYCNIEIVTKDTTFTGNVLWASWTEPVFQDLVSDIIWGFYGTQTLSLYTDSNMVNINYKKVSADTLYEPSSGKILQLVSSNSQTIDVCEYAIFSSCDLANLLTLIRGFEIRISSPSSEGTIGGNVFYTQNAMYRSAAGTNLYPRNKPLSFQLVPFDTYRLESVEGCGGVLDGDNYNVSTLTGDCNILVTFTKTNN